MQFFYLLNLKYIKYRPNTSLASRSLSSSGSISKTNENHTSDHLLLLALLFLFDLVPN